MFYLGQEVFAGSSSKTLACTYAYDEGEVAGVVPNAAIAEVVTRQ